jgi:hypothetical protein
MVGRLAILIIYSKNPCLIKGLTLTWIRPLLIISLENYKCKDSYSLMIYIVRSFIHRHAKNKFILLIIQYIQFPPSLHPSNRVIESIYGNSCVNQMLLYMKRLY